MAGRLKIGGGGCKYDETNYNSAIQRGPNAVKKVSTTDTEM